MFRLACHASYSAFSSGFDSIPSDMGTFLLAEAAKAVGLSYSQTMRKIILPQALKIVIPALVNTAIGFFKDTTLVIIIGLFDFLNAIKASLTDPGWLSFHIEGYVFAAVVYFVFCFIISRYSLWLERKLAPERIR